VFDKLIGQGSVTWIVAFLGNPGSKYAGTRHNAGFMAADAFAAEHGVSIDRLRFRALTATVEIAGEKVLLMKPQTYMNLSGEAVGQAARFYKVSPEHIIIVSDEVALPIGRMRIRKSGSAGGHNGLKNIIAHLGTEDFPRIRMGVGAPPHPDYDMVDWVLATFKNQDADAMEELSKRVSAAISCYIGDGADRAMNIYNQNRN